MDRTLSALFDNRSDAVSAVDDLVASGVSRERISVISGSEQPEMGAGGGYGTGERGFWSSLSDFFIPEEDVQTYEEGISRGGATVVAKVDDAQVDRAIDVLESHNAVDLDEREREWRKEGWTGPYRPGAAAIGMAGGAGAPTMGTTAEPVAPTTPPAPMPTEKMETKPSTTEGKMGMAGEEEVIPVVREELHVGKRDVGGGRVRIHSHMVEEPVSEDIRLRDEHVTIERHPVDGPTGKLGEDAFRERTVDVEEHHEEPVISKEARITEELRVRKEAEEHVEHIEDKVRHTEVDVEDDRPAKGPPGRSK